MLYLFVILDFKISILKYYIKKESPNTYIDIDKVIEDILANIIKKEHLINYLKHSDTIYKIV